MEGWMEEGPTFRKTGSFFFKIVRRGTSSESTRNIRNETNVSVYHTLPLGLIYEMLRNPGLGREETQRNQPGVTDPKVARLIRLEKTQEGNCTRFSHTFKKPLSTNPPMLNETTQPIPPVSKFYEDQYT